MKTAFLVSKLPPAPLWTKVCPGGDDQFIPVLRTHQLSPHTDGHLCYLKQSPQLDYRRHFRTLVPISGDKLPLLSLCHIFPPASVLRELTTCSSEDYMFLSRLPNTCAPKRQATWTLKGPHVNSQGRVRAPVLAVWVTSGAHCAEGSQV